MLSKLEKNMLPAAALFILINLIVLFNSVVHNPFVGYDAGSHLLYASQILDGLPSKADNKEYFSPPLPYLVPGIAFKVCDGLNGEFQDCLFVAGKVGQVINWFLSIGVTIYLLKIISLVNDETTWHRPLALTGLALLPVYFKTFSQFRGEPYVAFFTVLLVYDLIHAVLSPQPLSWTNYLRFGLLISLIALSRQWGFLLFPAVVLFVLVLLWKYSLKGKELLKALSVAAVIGFLFSGWFYIYHFVEDGTILFFNRDPAGGLSFANQPPSFYLATGLQDFRLFKAPVRENFANQLFPIFYSDTWGDYWGFFSAAHNPEQLSLYVDPGAGLSSIAAYLGRVNLVSTLVSLVLLFGVIAGFRSLTAFLFQKFGPLKDKQKLLFALIALIILLSAVGYFWFVVSYPNELLELTGLDGSTLVVQKGDTIKASYMIQVFVLLPLLFSSVLQSLRNRSTPLFYGLLILLAAIFLHNLPAVLTHYPGARFFQ